MSAVSSVQSITSTLRTSLEKAEAPKKLSSLEAVLPQVPKVETVKPDVKLIEPGKAKRTLAHESKAYLAQQWMHIHNPVENLKLEKLTPEGRYAYSAARKLKECAFKETDEKLTAAITKYSDASFVFLDMKIKKEVIETLCSYATNETAKDALRRFHLERFCPHDNKTPICYSFEAEHTNENMYDWYGPKNDVLELKDAKVNLKDFHTYLTKDAKKKWPTDETEITKEFIEKTFKWTDLTLSGRKTYVLSMPLEERQLLRRACAPNHLEEKLDWANKIFYEVKTSRYYSSLDALYFGLDEVRHLLGPGSFHVHVTFAPKIRDDKSALPVVYHVDALNKLIFLEHTSPKNIKSLFWDIHSRSELELFQKDLCGKPLGSDDIFTDVSCDILKCFYLGFRANYSSSTLRGFEIRGGNGHRNSSVPNSASVNYWGQMAGMLSDILVVDGFDLITFPKPMYLEKNALQMKYGLSENAQRENMSTQDFQDFFDYATFLFAGKAQPFGNRVLMPLINWQEMPYFPKNKDCNKKYEEIQNKAVDAVVLLVKDFLKNKAVLKESDALKYGEAVNEILLQFQKDLLELTKVSREEFRAQLQLLAWAKEKSLKST